MSVYKSLLCIVPFLSKDLLTHWSEVSNYLVYDDYFMYADTYRVVTETELYKTSSYILVQILCSEKSHHAVERVVVPLFVQPK